MYHDELTSFVRLGKSSLEWTGNGLRPCISLSTVNCTIVAEHGILTEIEIMA